MVARRHLFKSVRPQGEIDVAPIGTGVATPLSTRGAMPDGEDRGNQQIFRGLPHSLTTAARTIR
jgi:hypothetical protein